MGTTLGRGPDLDQIKTPRLQDPRSAITASAEDNTLYSNYHAAHRSCQDVGAISARPRTTPRTTATPGASLSSAAQCTFYSS